MPAERTRNLCPHTLQDSVEAAAQCKTTERYIGCKQNFKEAVNEPFGISAAKAAALESWELLIAGDIGDSVLWHSLRCRTELNFPFRK